MTTDLTFVNNQNWLLIYNMSQWTALYDFATALFRMQVRRGRGDMEVVYAFANYQQAGVRGTIVFDQTSQLMTISASYGDVRTYLPAGVYAHDLTIEVDDPISGLPLVIRDMAAGSLTITDGVTLR